MLLKQEKTAPRYVFGIFLRAWAVFPCPQQNTIFIGVADDGSAPGLSQKDVGRINQLISNAASQGVRSPLTVETAGCQRN